MDIGKMVENLYFGPRESSGKLHPSALGGCPRREMYRFKGYTETHPMPRSTSWMLKMFGWTEIPILLALEKEGIVNRNGNWQPKVSNEHWSGKEDIRTEDTLIEVKSVSPWVTRGRLPYQHHLDQTYCYYLLEEEPKPKKVLLVYFTRFWEYEHKDTGKVRYTVPPEIWTLDVTPTDQDLADTRAKMAELESWSHEEDLPPRPFDHPGEHNWYCVKQVLNRVTWIKEPVIQCAYFGQCWPKNVYADGSYNENGEPSELPF